MAILVSQNKSAMSFLFIQVNSKLCGTAYFLCANSEMLYSTGLRSPAEFILICQICTVHGMSLRSCSIFALFVQDLRQKPWQNVHLHVLLELKFL